MIDIGRSFAGLVQQHDAARAREPFGEVDGIGLRVGPWAMGALWSSAWLLVGLAFGISLGQCNGSHAAYSIGAAGSRRAMGSFCIGSGQIVVIGGDRVCEQSGTLRYGDLLRWLGASWGHRAANSWSILGT